MWCMSDLFLGMRGLTSMLTGFGPRQCFLNMLMALRMVALEGLLSWKRSPDSSTRSEPCILARDSTSSKAAKESLPRTGSYEGWGEG